VEQDFASERVADQLGRLIALSSGSVPGKPVSHVGRIERKPNVTLFSSMTWNTDGELTID
jgi:hypothetical protein